MEMRNSAFHLAATYIETASRKLRTRNAQRLVHLSEDRNGFVQVHFRRAEIADFHGRMSNVVMDAGQRFTITTGTGKREKRKIGFARLAVETHAVKKVSFDDPAD